MKSVCAALAVLAFLGTGCSTERQKPAAAETSNGLPTSLAGLPVGSGRLAGHVGPGRPGETGSIPALKLTFSNGETEVETTVHEGIYTVDLRPGTWAVRSDDQSLCATGMTVRAAAWQSNDLAWPLSGCQNLSSPAPGPTGP